MYCQKCYKDMKHEKICPNCGYDRTLNYPSPEKARRILKSYGLEVTQSRRNTTSSAFSDEERLSLGLYPKDDGYKMSLISKILGK